MDEDEEDDEAVADVLTSRLGRSRAWQSDRPHVLITAAVSQLLVGQIYHCSLLAIQLVNRRAGSQLCVRMGQVASRNNFFSLVTAQRSATLQVM